MNLQFQERYLETFIFFGALVKHDSRVLLFCLLQLRGAPTLIPYLLGAYCFYRRAYLDSIAGNLDACARLKTSADKSCR